MDALEAENGDQRRQIEKVKSRLVAPNPDEASDGKNNQGKGSHYRNRVVRFRLFLTSNRGDVVMRRMKLIGLALAAGLVLTGCVSTPPLVPERGNQTTLDDVAAATFLVEAEGSFADLGTGEIEFESTGSGFFIDPSGIGVTASHVVSGAGIVRVRLAGEESPRNAKVLGVSECNDLAVIQVDGIDFPTLSWFEGEITPGTEVYAAGYPGGDYALTRGIVSQTGIRAETEWASVSGVIKYDATTSPGSSGGPVVTDSGEVIGISYAVTEQFPESWALSGESARTILETLEAGESPDSIGINVLGFGALAEEDSGVWVTSVDPSSAAYAAGIEAGDIITTLNGVSVGGDGTVSRFCDVIRSSVTGQPLPIQVVRSETGQVLEGELNGEEIQESFSFANEFASETGAFYDYVAISDNSGRINLEVPSAWTDSDGRVAQMDGAEVFDLIVAEDVDDFVESWGYSGARISASYDLAATSTEIEVLEGYYDLYSSECYYEETVSYADAFYTGEYDIYSSCGGTDTTFVVVAVVPENRAFIIWIEAQIVSDADWYALDRIFDTFVFS